jgi:hypothetical protein
MRPRPAGHAMPGPMTEQRSHLSEGWQTDLGLQQIERGECRADRRIRASLGSDIGWRRLQVTGRASHYLEYLPINCPSARTWPRIAPSNRSRVVSGPRSRVPSSA